MIRTRGRAAVCSLPVYHTYWFHKCGVNHHHHILERICIVASSQHQEQCGGWFGLVVARRCVCGAVRTVAQARAGVRARSRGTSLSFYLFYSPPIFRNLLYLWNFFVKLLVLSMCTRAQLRHSALVCLFSSFSFSRLFANILNLCFLYFGFFFFGFCLFFFFLKYFSLSSCADGRRATGCGSHVRNRRSLARGHHCRTKAQQKGACLG